MNSDIQGPWRGWFDSGVIRVQLCLRIEGETARLQTSAGELTLPLRRRRRRLHIVAPTLDITLVLRPDGERLAGWCLHGRAVFPVNFERGERAVEPRRARPQTLNPPFPYETREITFVGADGTRRAGSLTWPPRTPRATVILSSWYGRVDRDQTVAGHRPMAIWADALTRLGFATLRYDKRGTGVSEGDFDRAHTGDFAADLACAVDWLRDQPGIDPERIGLLGHSEGAHLSSDVAARDPRIAFCVAMTPSGGPEEESFETELFRPVLAVGGRPWFGARTMGTLRSVARIVREAETEDAAREELTALLRELTAHGRFHAERIETYAQATTAPWRWYWWNYDQTAGLRALTCRCWW